MLLCDTGRGDKAVTRSRHLHGSVEREPRAGVPSHGRGAYAGRLPFRAPAAPPAALRLRPEARRSGARAVRLRPAVPRYLVTSALPYANGPIHFGHVIGAYLPADVYVRYRRMRGDDTLFVCGTDEHGVAITINAEAAGVGYREFVDRWHRVIGDTLAAFGIQFDTPFSGTNRCRHHERISQRYFKNLHENGYLLRKTERQWYCEKDAMFLADRYLEGTCPFCGAENARGDECKKCGQWIDALALKNPHCKLCGTTPVVRETAHWYLDLPKLHADGVGAWFEGKNPRREHVEWKPNVRSFVGNMLADLHPRPITRDLRWGVPLPAPFTEDGKVLYVWFDAPIGYCSITQEVLEDRARRNGETIEDNAWLDWWAPKNPSDVRLIHFIGKDNIGFHTIVFPSMSFGQGDRFGHPVVMPWAVPAMEFYNLQGRKFSTSDGWTIDPIEFLKRYPNVDAARFTLLSTSPETADSEFTFEDFQRVNNRDLADNLGNLLSRALRFAKDKLEGVVDRRDPTEAERALYAEISPQIHSWAQALEKFEIRNACSALVAIGRATNRYFDACAPWSAIKSDRAAAERCIDWTTRCLGIIGILSEPFLPQAARAIRESVGIGGIDLRQAVDELLARSQVTAAEIGFRVGEVPILFQKIDDKTIAAEVAALRERAAASAKATTKNMTETVPNAASQPAAPTPAAAPAPAAPAPGAGKPEITIDDFAKVELRVGTVLVAERVPKADKLLRLEVDLGTEKRQVLSGIAMKYAPEQLVGKRVVVVCNLAPRTMRGIESRGMILAADDGSGPVIVSPTADVAAGATVK